MRFIVTRARALVSTVGLVASWSTAAGAAPFELEWSAPAGCPSRDAIVDATHARLGEPRSEAAPKLFVQGIVTESSAGFSVVLAMKDTSGRSVGEREVRVDDPRCKEIEGPTSLVLAMMIAVVRPRTEASANPDERLETPPTSTAPPPAPETSRTPYPEPRLRPATRLRSHRLLIGAAAVASRGVLPKTGTGFALRAVYSPSPIVLFGLEASAETSGSVRAGAGEVGFALFGASARVGLSVLRASRFELIPTLGARLALIHNMPKGYQAVYSRMRPTILAGPGLLVRFELMPSLFLEVLPEVEGIFVRDRLRIRDGGKLYPVHRPSALEGRLSIGVSYEFR